MNCTLSSIPVPPNNGCGLESHTLSKLRSDDGTPKLALTVNRFVAWQEVGGIFFSVSFDRELLTCPPRLTVNARTGVDFGLVRFVEPVCPPTPVRVTGGEPGG